MISIRKATHADMSAVVAFAKRKLEGSTYDGVPFNAVIARRTVKRALEDGDARVYVATREGELCGFIIGEIGPMPMSHHMGASDLAFLADAGGDLLVDEFIHWCRLRKVARIAMGVSASTAAPRSTRFFRRKGFSEGGGLFYMNLLDEQQHEREVA